MLINYVLIGVFNTEFDENEDSEILVFFSCNFLLIILIMKFD